MNQLALKALERLPRIAAESKGKAISEIESHGSRRPINLIDELIGMVETLRGILIGNPDPDVVEAYSTSIASLAIQTGSVAPDHFTDQSALPMSEPEQYDLSELVAA